MISHLLRLKSTEYWCRTGSGSILGYHRASRHSTLLPIWIYQPQSHVFSAARKSECNRERAGRFFFDYFSGQEEPLLGKHPKLSDRLVFSIGRERRFSRFGAEAGHVLEIRSIPAGWQSFHNPLRTPIPEPAALFLELVLSAMDGSRTVAELMNMIKSNMGASVTNREVALFLRALHDSAFCTLV